MQLLRQIGKWLRPSEYLLYENHIWRVGDRVTAETDWNLSTSKIDGIIVYSQRYGWYISGIVRANTDAHARQFSIFDCGVCSISGFNE